MDALTLAANRAGRGQRRDRLVTPGASMPVPPEAPLAMPAQSLTEFTAPTATRLVAPRLPVGDWLARLVVFGGGLALDRLRRL